MTGQVFATKWDFLYASVLIGIDRSTGVFSGSEPAPGQPMVCVWTSDEAATEALHVESWDIKQIKVRVLLSLVPDGYGIVVDPERPSGMTATAAYVAQLKPYVAPFPEQAQIRVSPWDGFSASVRQAVTSAVSHQDLVRELYAFSYTVDDSPALGCLAYVVKGTPAEVAATARSLEGALYASADLETLGVATVNILPLDEVPDRARAMLSDTHLIHRRRQSRPWRR